MQAGGHWTPGVAVEDVELHAATYLAGPLAGGRLELDRPEFDPPQAPGCLAHRRLPSHPPNEGL